MQFSITHLWPILGEFQQIVLLPKKSHANQPLNSRPPSRPEYNVLPEIIHRFSLGQFFSQPMPGLNLAASSAKSLGEETLRSISSAAKTLPTVIASKATA